MIEISLHHRFDGFDLAADLSVPNGVTAVFGHSGSGKTSLVNAVAGLLRADQARIRINGRVIEDTSAGIYVPPHRRRIGYVFQEARLFPHMSVRANLRYGQWRRSAAGGDQEVGGAANWDHVIDMLGIAPLLARRPDALSGGERQRVAIGRALLSDPALLLMDEPLAALDAARKNDILPYLERLRDDLKIPMLYVSHAVSEVARLATTVALMEHGHLVRVGPIAEVFADPALVPMLGTREAGAVLEARIIAQHDDGLTELTCAGGTLWLPRVTGTVGSPLRVRISASDVMLARSAPQDISALNVLQGVVRAVRIGDGPGAVVQMQVGDALLLARVTRRSVSALGIEVGMHCYAIAKSVAVARADIGVGPS